jgi:hypothetical protein
MSTENPYASPAGRALPPRVAEPPASPGAPPWFLTVCILTIILGGLGLVSVLVSTLAMVTPQPPELMAVYERWSLASMGDSAFHLVVSLAILAGGILTLRRNPSGPGVLSIGSLLAIPYQLISMVISLVVVKETLAVVPRQKQPGVPEEAILEATYWLTVVAYSAWSLFIVAAMVGAVMYLKRPAVQALFAEPSI